MAEKMVIDIYMYSDDVFVCVCVQWLDKKKVQIIIIIIINIQQKKRINKYHHVIDR